MPKPPASLPPHGRSRDHNRAGVEDHACPERDDAVRAGENYRHRLGRLVDAKWWKAAQRGLVLERMLRMVSRLLGAASLGAGIALVIALITLMG